MSVHPSAADLHTQGCAQELIPYSSSGWQECPGLMVHLEAPVAVRGQGRDRGSAQLLGPDRKETSPPWSVTQTRWGCAGVQACGVVTDRNRSKAAGRKPLGGTPAAGAGAWALAALTTSGPAIAPLGKGAPVATSPCWASHPIWADAEDVRTQSDWQLIHPPIQSVTFPSPTLGVLRALACVGCVDQKPLALCPHSPAQDVPGGRCPKHSLGPFLCHRDEILLPILISPTL